MERQKALYPDLAPFYDKFAELHSKKLWHQLTEALDEFLSNKNNLRGNNYVELYNEFIANFEARLNPIRLVQMASIIGHSIPSPAEGLLFFNRMLTSRERMGIEASLCLDMDIVLMKLKAGEATEAKIGLDEGSKILNSISTSESFVYSKYYKSSYEYRKIAGPPELFYKEAITYLSYTPVTNITAEDQFILATDMALAALISGGIYNFGEVLGTPVLHVLKNSPNSWLHELVVALHRGNIDDFNSIVDKSKDKYFQQPSLASKHEELKQKVVLLSVMNMVFERAAHDRTITFSEISNRSRIPLDQVEWVLMRAMSLGLIKGSIDELAQTTSITWVQPRHMDMEQVKQLCSQLDTWTDKVKTVLTTIEDQTPELFS